MATGMIEISPTIPNPAMPVSDLPVARQTPTPRERTRGHKTGPTITAPVSQARPIAVKRLCCVEASRVKVRPMATRGRMRIFKLQP